MFGKESQDTSRHDDEPSSGRRRVVCELDASHRSAERILDALAACEEHDAELHVVWVFEPRRFGATFGGSTGSFGLPAVLARAIELARERGVAASSAVRFGEHEVVLREAAGRNRAPVSLLPATSPTSSLAA